MTRRCFGAGTEGFARLSVVIFILLLLAGIAGVWVLSGRSRQSPQADNAANQSGSGKSSFSQLTVTGALKATEAFILAPQSQPVQPADGQIYFDAATKKLAYYDGTQFVVLQGDHAGGVQSLAAGSSNVTIANDGTGNLTLSVSSASTGSISAPVSVANGGTGATSFAANGVLLGNGTAALTTVVAGGSGLCLLSTSGSPEFAACPGSSGNPFQQGGNSFGATAVLGTDDSQSLTFETSNSTQLTIAVGGAATFQNSANSASAFRVLSSSSVPQFVVDTSNSRVYVGNPTGDTTGALLVFDAKTTSGDPAGVEGAMYYNGALAVMRCYTDGYWRDCSNNERTGYTYIYDMAADHDSEVAFSGTYYGVASNYDGHPGNIDFHVINNGEITGLHGSLSVRMGGGTAWRNETDLRMGGTLSNGTDRYVVAAGFADSFSGDITAISNGCYLRYSDNVNGGKWQGVCETSGTESVCDTGVTVASDTWYRLTTVVNSAGTTADFSVNGGSSCQLTTNIPTGSNTTNFKILMNKTAGTNDRAMTLDYVSIRAQFDTAR